MAGAFFLSMEVPVGPVPDACSALRVEAFA